MTRHRKDFDAAAVSAMLVLAALTLPAHGDVARSYFELPTVDVGHDGAEWCTYGRGTASRMTLIPSDDDGVPVFDGDGLEAEESFDNWFYITDPPPQPEPPPNDVREAVQSTPSEQAMICGPDVTDAVFFALRELKSRWDSVGFIQRKDVCGQLLGTGGFPIWDNDALLNAGQLWSTSYPQCQRPSPPCGGTVEFLGQCLAGGLVNYTIWGMMFGLCSPLGRVPAKAYSTTYSYAMGVAGSLSGGTYGYKGGPAATARAVVAQWSLIDVGFDFARKQYSGDFLDAMGMRSLFGGEENPELSPQEKLKKARDEAMYRFPEETLCKPICPRKFNTLSDLAYFARNTTVGGLPSSRYGGPISTPPNPPTETAAADGATAPANSENQQAAAPEIGAPTQKPQFAAATGTAGTAADENPAGESQQAGGRSTEGAETASSRSADAPSADEAAGTAAAGSEIADVPPAATTTIHVKERRTALDGDDSEPTGTDIVKLFPLQQPQLPGKDDESQKGLADTGFDQPPVQCLLDSSGECTMTIAAIEAPTYGLWNTGHDEHFSLDIALPAGKGTVIETTGLAPVDPIRLAALVGDAGGDEASRYTGLSAVPGGLSGPREIRIGDRLFLAMNAASDVVLAAIEGHEAMSSVTDAFDDRVQTDICSEKKPGPPLGSEPVASAGARALPQSTVRLWPSDSEGRSAP